eukprot:32942-Hanusia_phi.AAC.1
MAAPGPGGGGAAAGAGPRPSACGARGPEPRSLRMTGPTHSRNHGPRPRPPGPMAHWTVVGSAARRGQAPPGRADRRYGGSTTVLTVPTVTPAVP